jgi:hypothetical protein
MRHKIAIALSVLALLVGYVVQQKGLARSSQVMIASGALIFWMNTKQSWFCIDAPESSQRLNRNVGVLGTTLTVVGLVLLAYRHGW